MILNIVGAGMQKVVHASVSIRLRVSEAGETIVLYIYKEKKRKMYQIQLKYMQNQ